MSKNHEYGDNFGEGVILCTCDNCGTDEEYEFFDGLSYKDAHDHVASLGWCCWQVAGEWKDFCCADCRKEYMSNN